MFALFFLFLFAAVSPVFADEDVGEIALVADTLGTILPAEGPCPNMLFGQGICVNEAAMAFYRTHPDNYDVLIFFANRVGIPLDVKLGFPVQQEIRGIGLETGSLWGPQHFGSGGRLLQCVNMGAVFSMNDNPYALGFLPPITGVELLAHEIGHHWLAWIMLDLDDGRGPLDILRGYDYQSESPNGHWSGYHSTNSVMYGNIIVDNGDGTFTSDGGVRQYSQLDQYLMGLRAPEEVEDMFYVVVDDDLHGNPAGASAPGYPWTYSGARVSFGIDDVIRANGPRVPATSICHLKVAFALVYPVQSFDPETPVDPATLYPTPQEIDKIDRYRQALEAWWPGGTDNRGSIDTTLSGCGLGTAECPGSPSPQCFEEPADCEDGEQRCNGLTLAQLCRNQHWVTVDTCVESETCIDGACYTPDEDGDIPSDGDVPEDGDLPVDGDVPDGDAPADGDKPDGDLPADGDALVDGDPDPIDGNLPDGDGGSSIIPPENDGSGDGCKQTGAAGALLMAWIGLAALGRRRAA
ncbi:MAG: hypothetical protein C4523_06045 [Myxococcales bacterium]|nr:MAG: hypothetical protein C4523_06045 [Myxococcales bacterium]